MIGAEDIGTATTDFGSCRSFVPIPTDDEFLFMMFLLGVPYPPISERQLGQDDPT